MRAEEVFLTFSAMVIVAGFAIVVLGLRHRTKMLEMAHRERLALIERGLVPAPETNPARFYSHSTGRHAGFGSRRSLSAGILIIGLGLSLALLIGLASDSVAGLGIGGAIAIMGGAFVTLALLARRDEQLAPTVVPPGPAPERAVGAPPAFGPPPPNSTE